MDKFEGIKIGDQVKHKLTEREFLVMDLYDSPTTAVAYCRQLVDGKKVGAMQRLAPCNLTKIE